MRQAVKHDLHTTEGLAQVQHLRFVLSSGEVDTQYDGMTIRGGVLDDGILEMPGSDVIDGRCALQLPRLAAGCHRYDILVSGNGTDNPLLAGVIHVAPRVTPVDVDDNAPADYLDLVIPEDEGGTITVISESPAWVDDAVEKSLQERGVYITPVDGVTTLIMSAGSNERDFNFYTFAVDSTYISGHLSTSYKLNKITLRTPAAQNNGTRWRARLHKITNASTMQTVELGESNSTATWVSINSSTAECSWIFNAIPIAASDRLVVEVYAVDASGATISKAFIAYGAAAAQGSTEGVLIKPEGELIWRNYTRLLMTLEVAYTDGVSVGGVELASKKHFDALTAGVAEEGEKASDSAEAAQAAQTAAEAAAERAGTSATNAASSATAAQQALAAIPQVDAGGNMTLAGGLTTASTINANGGINIPLTAGAATDTAAVNRMYAAGLAAVAETYNLQIYLDRTLTTATNNATLTERVPGQLVRAFVAAGKSSSINLGMDHSIIGRSGYSKFGGFTLPIRMSANNATVKITLGMGGGSMSVRPDRDVDDYTRVPVSAEFFGEVLDVTITSTRDAEAGGYWVRVREIGFNFSDRKNFVKTTRALLPYDGNTAIPAAISGLVYHQFHDGSWSVSDGIRGALWLMLGGYSDYTCVRIANVRGIHTYQSVGFNACHLDIYSTTNGTTVDLGAPRTMQRFMRGYNPAYYGFEAVEYNAIKSETTEDFVDPDTQA